MSSKIKLTNTNGKITTIGNNDGSTSDIEVSYFNTVDELANASGVEGAIAIVSDLDRGGNFKWSSSGTHDGGVTFSGSNGYWVRQYSGAVNVKWFGAKGDGVTDDAAIFNKIKTAFPNGGITLLIDGDYAIHEKVIFPPNIKITGDATINYMGDATASRYDAGIILLDSNTRFEGNFDLINDVTTSGTLTDPAQYRWGIEINPFAINPSALVGLKNVYIGQGVYLKDFFYSISSRTAEGATPGTLRNNNINIEYVRIDAPTTGISGAILIRETKVCNISSNEVSGGTTSSAIGVTMSSQYANVFNNKVTNNHEASIQIEGNSQYISVYSNDCDGAIWSIDSDYVTIENNISDTIRINTQKNIVTDNKISSNITGNIWVSSIYTPEPAAALNSIYIYNNIINGAIGYWDNTLASNAHGIFFDSYVNEIRIDNNKVAPSVFTNDLTITASNASAVIRVFRNTLTNINLVGTLNADIEEFDNIVSIPNNLRTKNISRLFSESEVGDLKICDKRVTIGKTTSAANGATGALLYLIDMPKTYGKLTIDVVLMQQTSLGVQSFKCDVSIHNDGAGSLTFDIGDVYAQSNSANTNFISSISYSGSTLTVGVRNNTGETADIRGYIEVF